VDLGKPRLGHVPTVGLHGNVVLQQRPRFGLPIQAPLTLALLPLQPPVDLPRTDTQQLPLRLRAGLVPAANPPHPVRQDRLQPHRPRIPRRFPYRRQQRHHRRTVMGLSSPCPSLLTLPRWRPVQQPNRVLPVITRGQTEFIQDPSLGLAFGFAVAPIYHPQVFPPRRVSHFNPPHSCSEVGLHLKWLDGLPFGNIMHGSIREVSHFAQPFYNALSMMAPPRGTYGL